jgi:hypothetical protein
MPKTWRLVKTYCWRLAKTRRMVETWRLVKTRQMVKLGASKILGINRNVGAAGKVGGPAEELPTV